MTRPTIRAEFRFGGAIEPERFADFAVDRILRLDLTGAPRIEGPDVLCDVGGQPDLVDAFEMACLLGPDGSLVTRVDRRDLRSGDGR